MVSDRRNNPIRLVVAGRDEADVLLHHLLHDRCRTEQRLSATGKIDPLRSLTGKSALDRAITSARALIRDMDGLIEELRGEATTNGAPMVEVERFDEPTVTNGEIVAVGRPAAVASLAR